MERINGHDTVDIGGGKRGFRSQNALAGVNGTEVTDAFLNSVQEEICTVIEKAGIVLDTQKNDQLHEALMRMVAPGFGNRTSWMPVISVTITAPPAGAALGDIYVIPAGATSVWSGQSQKLAEWNGTSWNIITTKDGHGVSLPDGRVFERVGGTYIEKLALDAQTGKWNYATAAGSANAITASLTPLPSALTTGMKICLRMVSANTGATTINVSGLGAKPVLYNETGTALIGGDWLAGSLVDFVYDGTNWRIDTSLNFLDGRYARLTTPPSNTFYVVGSTGNDNNSGLANTAADGFATIQGAINAISSRYLTVGGITINVANGNYGGFSVSSSFVSSWRIKGNDASPHLVVVSATTPSVNTGRACVCNGVQMTVSGMEFNSYYENVDNNSGIMSVANCNIKMPLTTARGAVATYGGNLSLTGTFKISGNGSIFLVAAQGGTIQVGYVDAASTAYVTFNYLNPNFSGANAVANTSGTLFVNTSVVTIQGAAVGTRFNVNTNGILDTGGAGVNFFPGTTAGTIWTGGQYV